MKEGGGAIQATSRTHHVGKEKDGADGEILRNSDPVVSMGNGSGDLENSGKEKERTSANERLEETTLPDGAPHQDGQRDISERVGKESPGREKAGGSVDLESRGCLPKLNLPQPEEAKASSEIASVSVCENAHVPSGRTEPGQIRTSSEVGFIEAKITAVCDTESRLCLGGKLMDQNDDAFGEEVLETAGRQGAEKCPSVEEVVSISEETLIDVERALALDSVKGIEDHQVSGTPNLGKSKKSLDSTEVEQSLDESRVEGPKRTEDDEVYRLKEWASASGADYKRKDENDCEMAQGTGEGVSSVAAIAAEFSESPFSWGNLPCEDDTLGSIASLDILGKEEDCPGVESRTESGTTADGIVEESNSSVAAAAAGDFSESPFSWGNLPCEDDTLGSIASVDILGKEEDCPGMESRTESGSTAGGNVEKNNSDDAVQLVESLSKNDLSGNNSAVAGRRRSPFQDEKTLRDEEMDAERAKNNEFEVDYAEEKAVAMKNERCEQGDNLERSKEGPEEHISRQQDKEDLLADEGLSLESVSETSFTLNDNTEDGKDDSDVLKDALGEDTKASSSLEKETGLVELNRDFLAELEDISSEDNEDFFAGMERVSVDVNEDSATDKGQVSLVVNEDCGAQKEAVSLGENEDSAVGKESNEDTMAGMEAISSHENEETVSEKEAGSMATLSEDVESNSPAEKGKEKSAISTEEKLNDIADENSYQSAVESEADDSVPSQSLPTSMEPALDCESNSLNDVADPIMDAMEEPAEKPLSCVVTDPSEAAGRVSKELSQEDSRLEADDQSNSQSIPGTEDNSSVQADEQLTWNDDTSMKGIDCAIFSDITSSPTVLQTDVNDASVEVEENSTLSTKVEESGALPSDLKESLVLSSEVEERLVLLSNTKNSLTPILAESEDSSTMPAQVENSSALPTEIGQSLALPLKTKRTSALPSEVEKLSASLLPEEGESSAPRETEESSVSLEAEGSTLLDEDESSAPLDGEESSTPLDEEETSAPLDEEESSAPLDEEESSAPLDEEQSSAPLDEEQSSAPLDEEQSSAPLDEEQSSAPLDEEQSLAPLDEEQSLAPLDEEENSAPVDEEESSAPLDEEESSAPLDEEESSAPLDEEERSAPLDEEESSVILEAEESSSPRDAEETSALLDEERSAASQKEESSTHLQEEDRSVPLDEERPAPLEAEESSSLETEANLARLETEGCSVLLETETRSASLETEASSAPLETEASTSPLETKASSAPLDTQASSAPVDTQARSAPVHTEASSAPVDTEASSAPVDTEASTAPVDTEASSAPVDTEASSAPVDTEASSAPVDTETSSAPVDTETSSAPVDTETSSAPVDTETSSAPVDTETSSAPVDTETSSAPVDTEANSAHVDTEANSAHVDTEASSAPIDTEASLAPVDTEACLVSVDTEASSESLDTEASSASVDTEASSAPLDTEASSASLDTEASSAPVEKEASSASLEIEASSASLETESSTVPLETDSSTVPLETDSSTGPLETDSSTAHVETDSSTAHVETESSTAPVGTESSTAPVETELNPAPVETESSPAPVETESGPAPVETEASPAPVETEASPAPVETEASPAPLETDATSAPLETEASSAHVVTGVNSDLVETEASLDLVETEASSDLVETEASSDLVETEASSDLVETEASTDLVEAEASSALVEAAVSLAAEETEASSALVEAAVSLAAEETEASSEPVEIKASLATVEIKANSATVEIKASSATVEIKASSAKVDTEASSAAVETEASSAIRSQLVSVSKDVSPTEITAQPVLSEAAGNTEECSQIPRDDTVVAECFFVSKEVVAEAIATNVADKEIISDGEHVVEELETVTVAAPTEISNESPEKSITDISDKGVGKDVTKFLKEERCIAEDLDIPLESLKQEELDIPSEPVDDNDLDGSDEPLEKNDCSYLKMEESADTDSFEESALVIDEGDESSLPEDLELLKSEAIKVSLGSEVSIKLVPTKGTSEPRAKAKEVQSVSIIPKENLLKTSDNSKRTVNAQSLVKQAPSIAPALAKVTTKVSKSSPKAPIPDLTPLQTDPVKTTGKAMGRQTKSTSLLKKAEQNATVKSLLKGPSPAGPSGNYKGKSSARGSDDFRPFPSLPKDTVVIPTYYVPEPDQSQASPSQPMNLSTSNDLPIIAKSIPASQPLPANVIPSQRAAPLKSAPPRAPPTKNVPLPPPLPIQSLMPKMDNNVFPSMWNLFGPQLLSSQFLAAAAGASGTIPPFPMDPQKQNLLGAMLAASSAMPRLPMPPEMNVYNTALMQMQAQMDAFMPPHLQEQLQNAPLPPDMNRYNAALMQMQAFMPPQMQMPPHMQMPPNAPQMPPAVPPAVPPFAKSKTTQQAKSQAKPQAKPQATILPQPKVASKPAVQQVNLTQTAVDPKPAAMPRKPGGRNTKFTPGSSPRLVKRPSSAAATAVAAGLKIPVPAVSVTARPSTIAPTKQSSPAVSLTLPPSAASKKFKVGSKLNSVVDKLLAGAGKQGSAVDLSPTAPPVKSSSPVPPRKDTPPLKETPPVKKVIQVTNALTIELDSRERRVRPPMPALLPCKPVEVPPNPCEVILVDERVNGCVSDPQVVLTPEQARKSVEVKRPEKVSEDDAVSVTCSLPLDKVSLLLDTAKKSPVPGCSGLPTLPPTLAAGGLEILPMEVANCATSTSKTVVPSPPIGANSISLGSNVSLTLTPTPGSQEAEGESPTPLLEEVSAVEPCTPVAQQDSTLEPTPSPPQLEPVSSPMKRPSGVQDGETSSPDKEVPSLDLEVPEGLDSRRPVETETPIAPSKAVANRKKFSFSGNSSCMMTLSGGQKLYTCDICSGVYQRAFSLKRHYLRSHINYSHLQERDISNCGIIVGNKMAVRTEPNLKVCMKDSKITVLNTDEEGVDVANEDESNDLDLPGLYRCYTCGLCFDLKDQLRTHLVEHQPTNDPDEEEEEQEACFTCEICSYPFRHKKNYFRHLEVCLKRKQTSNQSEWLCLFCTKTFQSAAVRSRHLSCMHKRIRPGMKKSRKSKVQKHTCLYCGSSGPKFNDLNSLLKHMITGHDDVYFGCLRCEERYPSKGSLEEHKSTMHTEDPAAVEAAPQVLKTCEEPEAREVSDSVEPELNEAAASEEPTAEEPKGKAAARKGDAFQSVCSVCKKMFVSDINMKRHKQLAHGAPRGKKKRRTGTTTQPPAPTAAPDAISRRKEAEEKLDPEALFYSRLSVQIRDNLMHHLDGKLDSQELFEREEQEPLVVKSEDAPAPLPNPAASAPQEQPENVVDPHKVKNIPRRRSSESYLRLTWDKFNINKDNSVSSFIRDMSHIDIPTQLIMRRNMKRLSEKDSSKCKARPTDDTHRLEYPTCIALTQSAEGARSLETATPESLVSSMLSVTTPVEVEEPSTSAAALPVSKPPLNPAEDFLNGPWKNPDLSNEVVELSGEWVRPKYYMCAACDSAFLENLYEMEDHQYQMHPNVWGTYWEFEESTLVPFRAAGIKSPSSLYQRSLKPTGSLISAPEHPAGQTKDLNCTKCSRANHSVSELHRHMLDCGGDTTWHLTMILSSPINGRRNRKWRPFGSRRRRQQGRRGLKRNIPNTPQRPKTNQPKTRGGDAETIQRMIANLPAKRSTRRVIQFKEDEVKTRSQATIASVPFPVSQSPLHKASRAILGRSMASSSSKPGHMPRARPLRASTTAAAAVASAAAIAHAATAHAATAHAATAHAALTAKKAPTPPKNQPEGDVATTIVQVQTLIPAKVKKLVKSGDAAAKATKAKASPKVSPKASTEAVASSSKEDIPESVLGKVSPGKGEKSTDVILEAMRQAMMSANFHLCSVCGRMFNNSANRDRHFRVCSAQAEEGMPRLRKEAPTAARSRQAGKNSDIPVLSPSTAVTPTAGDSLKTKAAAKTAESHEEPAAGAELTASGKKKKRTIVGIRKSLVKSEESGGEMVVTESFLVRVDSSSNELSEPETKDKAEEELSDDFSFDGKAVAGEMPTKKKKKKGAKRSKAEAAVETPLEEKKKKKKKAVANEGASEVPVKKLTRSKQASPQKVPVMRVDRSLNPDIIVSGSEVAVPGTVGAKSEEDVAPDNLDFEELLNIMDAEEVKQLDIIVPETPSSDADDDIPLGEKIPIWKKEAEALEEVPGEGIPVKTKKGTKRPASDVASPATTPAPKKTRSSSVLAEELLEAIEVEEEEESVTKKGRSAKNPVVGKVGRNKSVQDGPTLMLPPIAIPEESPKKRRRSSVVKVDPPVVVDVVSMGETTPVKGLKKKKAKAAAKLAVNVADAVEPCEEPVQVASSAGKKKTKASKQADSVTSKTSLPVGDAVEVESRLVQEVKPSPKRKLKGAAKISEPVVPSEPALCEEVSPVSKKKKSKAAKSAENIQPVAVLVEEPKSKKKSKVSKLSENIEGLVADVVELVKPVSKRKSKGAAKQAETEVPEPEPESLPKFEPVYQEEFAPATTPVEIRDAAAVSSPAPTPVSTPIPAPASTPVPTPVSKKKSKAAAAKSAKAAKAAEVAKPPEVAEAADNVPLEEPQVNQGLAPSSKKKSKAVPKTTETISESEAETSVWKKKTKASPKPTDKVIEPDPNLVGELTPRNRKRIQPLDGETKKTKGKFSDKIENPSSPAVATPEVATTPPATTKKAKVAEEPAATTAKEATPLKDQPVKRKWKKRPANLPASTEQADVPPEGKSPKVNRKRPRSSPGDEGSKPAPKGRGKKKAKMTLDAGLDSSAAEESVPEQTPEKSKGGKKNVKTEDEEPLAYLVDAGTPAAAEIQSKPKKKSRASKSSVEQADDETKDVTPCSGVSPLAESDQAKSSEGAAAPTPSTPMDPPAANSPTPGEQPEITPKKRKSSIGSQFFCDLCQRHYSTAYNLTKHLSSLSHRALLRGTQSSEIVAAAGDVEKPIKVIPKTEETDQETVSAVSEDEQSFLEIGKDPLKNPILQTSDNVGSQSSMDDKADAVVLANAEVTQSEINVETPLVQSEEPLVQNVQVEEAVPQQTPVEQERPRSSQELNGRVEEKTVSREEMSQESIAVPKEQIQEKAPEPTYTPLESVPEINPMDQEPLPVPNPAQASLVQPQEENQFPQDYGPTPTLQEIHHQGYSQEQCYPEQQYNCYENRNWQGGDSGWGPWRIPDAADEMSNNMGFGLGSILDSVNQVLAGDGGVGSDLPDSVYTGYALNEIQNAVGATDEEMAVLRQLGEGSFEELVGAPGSVMWPPAEETQLLDLDNQRPNQAPVSEKAPPEAPLTTLTPRKSSKSPAPSTSGARTPTKTPNNAEPIPSTSSRDDTRSPVSMLPRPKTVPAGGNSLNELYEDRQMWCPSCHRRFLGLQAMKAHMAQHHSQNQRVERKATLSAEGSSEHRIICEVCREMVVDQVALELHMEELHSGHNDPSKAVPASPSPGAKSRVLRMQMSHALGGLLDRALKNYLSKATTGAASSVDTDRSRFTLGLLNKLALRHQANQRESPRATPNPSETDGDAASSGSTTPTNMGPKRRNSRTEPMFVQYQGHPCPHCPEKFMSDAFVKRHINNVHANVMNADPAEGNLSDSESRAASPMEFCADPVVGEDGAFLCSSCGINFKSPSEVLEHQRVQHPQPTPEELAQSAAENEERLKLETPVTRVSDAIDAKADDDVDSAEIAEKVSEFQQRVANPLKGRSLLTKDLKNKKIALAVESALLEHTAEVQLVAEAALRELGPCRKSSKSSTKESPKWGIDAVKFTVAKEPALIGAYGPVSEQESRLRNIPIVRKTSSSAPRFSFAERKKLSKPSTEVKPFKEKMEIYEFDESPRIEPLMLELKREVEEVFDKSSKIETQTKDSSEEKRTSPPPVCVSEAIAQVVEVQPPKAVTEWPVKIEAVQTEEEAPKKAPAKKRQSSAKRKEAPGEKEGTPSKVAKVEKKKIFKKRKSDQGESAEGPKSRAPRAEKEKGDGEPSGRARKQRRASTHDATDYSVFDFSSDESSVGAAVDVSAEASGTQSPTSPRARRESVSPPKKGTPSRVQELVEEDWTWLDDSESEKEKRKKMARRKRTKKKEKCVDSPKKQGKETSDKDPSEEVAKTKTTDEGAGGGSSAGGAAVAAATATAAAATAAAYKRRKRSETSSVAGSSGEAAR